MSTTLQSSNSNATTYSELVAGLLASWAGALSRATCAYGDAEHGITRDDAMLERSLEEARLYEILATRELSLETRVGVYYDRDGNQVIGTVNPSF